MIDEYKLIKGALETLQLPPFVSIKEIRDRYLELVKKHHDDFSEDVNQKDSMIRRVNEAYAILKNYAQNYRFRFDEDEIKKQFPKSEHVQKFGF